LSASTWRYRSAVALLLERKCVALPLAFGSLLERKD
jgi:hypothetical protein